VPGIDVAMVVVEWGELRQGIHSLGVGVGVGYRCLGATLKGMLLLVLRIEGA